MKISHIKKLRTISAVIISLSLCLVVTLKGVKQKTISELTSKREAYHQKRAEVTLLPKAIFNEQALPKYETAILDRFEQNHAVILLEASHQEIILPRQMLPVQVDDNTWFDVWTDSVHITLSINEKKTKQKQEDAKQLQKQLKQK